jgi:hypothetical protein
LLVASKDGFTAVWVVKKSPFQGKQSIDYDDSVTRNRLCPPLFLRAPWLMENAAWDIASAGEGNIQCNLSAVMRS